MHRSTFQIVLYSFEAFILIFLKRVATTGGAPLASSVHQAAPRDAPSSAEPHGATRFLAPNGPAAAAPRWPPGRACCTLCSEFRIYISFSNAFQMTLKVERAMKKEQKEFLLTCGLSVGMHRPPKHDYHHENTCSHMLVRCHGGLQRDTHAKFRQSPPPLFAGLRPPVSDVISHP